MIGMAYAMQQDVTANAAALKAVVRLLQTKPALKLWVVGHTDYVGTTDANLVLSSARAAAVVKVLTRRL